MYVWYRCGDTRRTSIMKSPAGAGGRGGGGTRIIPARLHHPVRRPHHPARPAASPAAPSALRHPRRNPLDRIHLMVGDPVPAYLVWPEGLGRQPVGVETTGLHPFEPVGLDDMDAAG